MIETLGISVRARVSAKPALTGCGTGRGCSLQDKVCSYLKGRSSLFFPPPFSSPATISVADLRSETNLWSTKLYFSSIKYVCEQFYLCKWFRNHFPINSLPCNVVAFEIFKVTSVCLCVCMCAHLCFTYECMYCIRMCPRAYQCSLFIIVEWHWFL